MKLGCLFCRQGCLDLFPHLVLGEMPGVVPGAAVGILVSVVHCYLSFLPFYEGCPRRAAIPELCRINLVPCSIDERLWIPANSKTAEPLLLEKIKCVAIQKRRQLCSASSAKARSCRRSIFIPYLLYPLYLGLSTLFDMKYKL